MCKALRADLQAAAGPHQFGVGRTAGTEQVHEGIRVFAQRSRSGSHNSLHGSLSNGSLSALNLQHFEMLHEYNRIRDGFEACLQALDVSDNCIRSQGAERLAASLEFNTSVTTVSIHTHIHACTHTYIHVYVHMYIYMHT